jgi:DNA-binding winged helix-turn-helix (wHTH) protein
MRYAFADFVLDLEARLLQRGGERVHLSPKAFDLLRHLLEARPRSVTRQELYDLLWPETFVVDTNLAVLINEIRQALGDREHVLVRTVPRHGYSFAAEAHPASGAESSIAPHVLIYGSTELPLRFGPNVVGRESGAAVRILSGSLSRRHAVVSVTAKEATVEDLQSKNGTLIDGRVVEGTVVLHDRVVISFGTVDVTYRRLPDDTTLTAI